MKTIKHSKHVRWHNFLNSFYHLKYVFFLRLSFIFNWFPKQRLSADLWLRRFAFELMENLTFMFDKIFVSNFCLTLFASLFWFWVCLIVFLLCKFNLYISILNSTRCCWMKILFFCSWRGFLQVAHSEARRKSFNVSGRWKFSPKLSSTLENCGRISSTVATMDGSNKSQ